MKRRAGQDFYLSATLDESQFVSRPSGSKWLLVRLYLFLAVFSPLIEHFESSLPVRRLTSVCFVIRAVSRDIDFIHQIED